MDRKRLEDYFEEEARSGALIDLWVDAPNINDWRRLLAVLYGFCDGVDLRVDDQPRSLPDDPSDIFLWAREANALFRVQLGRATLNLHANSPDDLEFTVDPREWPLACLDRLVAFMSELGMGLAKPVLLGASMGNHVALRFDPMERRFRDD